jgi:predicted O-methyltransferase YrrM
MRADEARRLAIKSEADWVEANVVSGIVSAIRFAARLGGKNTVIDIDPRYWETARSWLDRNGYRYSRSGTATNNFFRFTIGW